VAVLALMREGLKACTVRAQSAAERATALCIAHAPSCDDAKRTAEVAEAGCNLLALIPTPAQRDAVCHEMIPVCQTVIDDAHSSVVKGPDSSNLGGVEGGFVGGVVGGMLGGVEGGKHGQPLYAGVGGVSNPELISKKQPIYPEIARKAKVSGQVILQVVVRKDGSVGDISVLRSPGSKFGFDEAAIAAVKQWRYKPAQQNGKPVDVYFTVVVDFVLED
jgi:TonB family protein